MSVIESRDFGQPGNDRGFAATQLGERTRGIGIRIGRFHGPQYGVRYVQM